MTEDRQNSDETQSYVVLSKGTMIGHYRIIEKIGAGGMGEVYLAQDTELDRKVALKFLPPHLCQDEDCRKRFKREAQAAAKLNHPNIITVFEVSEFKGRPFFAMEHATGNSLSNLIKGKELGLDRVIELAIGVCDGLREAHEAGIVHRDVKPSNIIIDKNGQPKLLDFGLAAVRGTTKLTKTGSTLGTVGYMSPEQIQGQKVDRRSDLFSFGVVLYEMITGHRPFKGKDEAATLHAVTQDTPEPLARYKSGITDELQRIVATLLHKDPSLRYQSAAQVVSDLRRLAASGSRPVMLSVREKRAKKLKWAAAISLVIIVTAWGGLQLKQMLAPEKAQAKSLAVLFFENLGAENESYLASGLAEDLAIKLRNVAGFRVASSADIRRLSKKDLLAKDVASNLGVQYALGGSLLREGEQIRVNVELIDEKTGDVIWSDQFNREFTEVFQFIDEISQRIAQALEVHLIPAEQLALREQPTDSPEAYDHYLKGRHYYYRVTFRDNELAAKEFERALQLDPDYPLALAGLADAYVQRYKERFDYDEYWLDSSDVLVNRALSLESELAEAYEARAEILIEKENYLGALEAAERAGELSPEMDEPYVRLGEIFDRRGERSKAMEMYEKALSIRASVDALCSKAGILYDRGKLDSAEAAYREAIELNPDHERPYAGLGRYYWELNQSEETEKMYRRAIEVRPDRAGNYWTLASLLSWRQTRHEEAEELLRGFVRDYPYNWDGYEALHNWLAWRKGDRLAAIAVVEQAVAQNPDRAWPYLALATSRTWGLGKTVESEKAIEETERALELRPRSSRVLRVAGRVYASLDSLDRAMDFYRQALEVNPGSSGILSSVAALLLQQRRYDSAALVAREVINQTPGLTSSYGVLSKALARLQRTDEYLAAIESAADKYGMDNPNFFRALGWEQRSAGLFREAIASYQRCLDIKRYIWHLVVTAMAHWMLGENDAALAFFQEGFQAEGADAYRGLEGWYISFLMYQGRHDAIERYLDSAHADSTQAWQWSQFAPWYYASMRRYDAALAVYAELAETGDPTWKHYHQYDMAEVKRLAGDISGARQVLEDGMAAWQADLALEARFSLALLAAIEGDLKHAISYAERASDDYSTSLHDGHYTKLARFQFAEGRIEEAMTTLGRIKGVYDDLLYPALYLKAQHENLCGINDTARCLEKAELFASRRARCPMIGSINTDIGKARCYWALASARLGDFTAARDAVEFAQRLEPERADIAYFSACTYSLLGDTALALQWLETAVERGHQELWWARVDPDLVPLRELPRFKEIMNDWDKRIKAMIAKSS